MNKKQQLLRLESVIRDLDGTEIGASQAPDDLDQQNNEETKNMNQAIKDQITDAVADLSGADLSGSDLSGADLSGADLSGADLSGADLSGAGLWKPWESDNGEETK